MAGSAAVRTHPDDTNGVDVDGLRIAVLGPLRAWRADRELDTGTAQQRAVLAALALRGGQVASVPELVDGLWGWDPPASAVVALRNHVSRLRSVLESDPRSPRALVSVAGGYALRLADGALDADRAELLAAEAARARAAGDLDLAARRLAEAIALWDGIPLTGVPGDYAERQRDRLAERRLALLETRLELELALGRHAHAVPELTALADEHPMREQLRALEMTALYRSGRQAAALAGYERTRRLLAEELGIDPGPELVDLHRRILRSDRALAAPEPAAVAPMTQLLSAPSLLVPAQLPSTVADFTGREAHVGELVTLLERPAATVCVVHGMGGVGKTALAVHAAHRARDRYPDGQLYTDLRGAGADPADPYAVQEQILRALGVPPDTVPPGPAERSALYRSRLAGRRLLIVLDNAVDTEQVEPLLPGASECAVLITSRNPLPCLPVTGRTALEPFSEPEALALLSRIAGPERLRNEPDAARALVRTCGLLPLAVRIAASRLAARPRWSIGALAERLTDRARRLTELESGSLAVDAAFELSYSALDPDQARAFRLLAIPELPALSPGAAAAVLDRPEREAEDALEALADVGLLESTDPGRYRYHDLLRLFARHRTLECDPVDERAAALSALARYYLGGVITALRLERPYSRLPDALDPELNHGPRLGGQAHAQRWVIRELPGLVRLVNQIVLHPSRPVGPEDTRTVAVMLAALLPSTDLRLPWRALMPAVRELARAAEQGDDPLVTYHAYTVLAVAHAFDGEPAQARDLARRAYEVELTRPADGVLRQRALYTRGVVGAMDQSSLDEAVDHFEQCRAVSLAVGETGMAAQAALGLAHAEWARKEPARALAHSRDSLRLWRDADCALGVAFALRSAGLALNALGRHDEATAEFTRALTVCAEHGLQTQRAHTLLAAATAEWDAGRPDRAAPLAAQAAAELDDLGDTAGRRRAQELLDRTQLTSA
ncbi:BTAD domain-containing putative transcriptional regulator [Kitasatospora sp. NPDC088346]|uniref:AfsR/SARP family transcriptional regulator n=1 Tax=Kitasatospora sp. NPDC088346 TaxID=3364073 RepID=UPI0037FF769E